MTITVTSTAKNYSPDKVLKRYVRTDGARYFWCEVGEDRMYDLRQGRCMASDLPLAVIEAAEKRCGYSPSYVEWPL